MRHLIATASLSALLTFPIARKVFTGDASQGTQVATMVTTVEPEPQIEPEPTPEWTRLCGPRANTDLDRIIGRVAADYDMDPAILATLVTKESRCNPNAIGKAGEIGLTQVHPKVWTKTLTKEGLISEASDLLDPETNLRCAAYIMTRHLKKSKGNIKKAFRRYNGSGKAARRYARHAMSIYVILEDT